MKFRGISDGIQIDFRGFSDIFKGYSVGSLGVSGGFLVKFQMDFRTVSGSSPIIFRFSVPLNQILFRMYSEHKVL